MFITLPSHGYNASITDAPVIIQSIIIRFPPYCLIFYAMDNAKKRSIRKFTLLMSLSSATLVFMIVIEAMADEYTGHVMGTTGPVVSRSAFNSSSHEQNKSKISNRNSIMDNYLI